MREELGVMPCPKMRSNVDEEVIYMDDRSQFYSSFAVLPFLI